MVRDVPTGRVDDVGERALYEVDTGIDTTHITAISNTIEELSGVPVPANKPIVGANAFAHESGIHAAGVIENTDTFEPGVMTPEMVGANRQLVLGKHTGTHSVRQRLVDEGFDPTDREVKEVTRRIKDYGAAKNRVTIADLRRFAKDVGVKRSEEVRV